MHRTLCMLMAAGLSVTQLSQLALAAPAAWLTPTNGAWELGGNWNSGEAPSLSTDDATLGLSGQYQVSLNSNRVIRSLGITNSLARLQISSGYGLTLLGGSSGQGTITIGDGMGGSNVALILGQNAAIGGAMTITMVPTGTTRVASIETTNGNTDRATINAGSTIKGTGYLKGTLSNYGTIGGGPMTGPTIIGSLAQGVGGRVFIDGANETVTLDTGGSLESGTIETTNGGFFSARRGTLLNNVRITAGSELRILTDGIVNVEGSINNSGTIRIGDGIGGSTASLVLGPNSAIGGSGTVMLMPTGTTRVAYLETSNGNTDTGVIAGGTTIRGQGYLKGTLANYGTIGGGPLSGPTIIGPVYQSNGGRIVIDGANETATLDTGGLIESGSIESANGRYFSARRGTLKNNVKITTGSELRVLTDGIVNVEGSINNSGIIRIGDGIGENNASLILGSNNSIGGTGTVVLMPTGTTRVAYLETSAGNTSNATISQGILIQGDGTLAGTLTNNGTISPGNASAGRIDVSRSLALSPSSHLIIDLNGPSTELNDSMQGTGTVYLAGKLTVQYGSAWRPSNCTKFRHRIINVGSLPSGDFSLKTLPPAWSGSGGFFTRKIGSSYWIAANTPDLNGDSAVDDSDFQSFVGAYDKLVCDPDDPIASDPFKCPADFNGDGAVDDQDFLVFVVAYNLLECQQAP